MNEAEAWRTLFSKSHGLRVAVAEAIVDTYYDNDPPTSAGRPDSDDVIAHALATIASDTWDRAEDMRDCNKIDSCAAQAEVMFRLAEWLSPETFRRLENGQ